MQVRCTQADHRNQQIIGVCIDITCQNQRPYCNFCLPLHGQHLQQLTSLDLINEWIQQRMVEVKNVYNNAQELKASIDSLINQFYTYYNFNINQIPELGLSQFDKLIKDLCQIQDQENVLFVQLKQSIEQVKSIINEILRKIKNQSNLNQNNNNTQISTTKVQLIQEQPKPLNKLTAFKFELIKQNSILQKDRCFAVAFNKDCSIVAAGCNSLIKIYEFRQGMLKQIQVLNQHEDSVNTLQFMKKSNQLISGDVIGSILIWSRNNDNQWIDPQTIKQHNDRINCLIMNDNEDIIISSSNDKTIRFLTKQQEWINSQIITDHRSSVLQLSLNEKQNKVISSGWDKLILVIEYSEQNKQWVVIQNIQVDCQGLRLCFINDNLFTFKPYKGNKLYFYEMNSETKQFTNTKYITVDKVEDNTVLFPQQYIKSKQLLVCKHKNINLIRKTDNDEFQIQQSIKFHDTCLFGQMSDDGEYLITWDDLTREIQIRKYIQE